MTKSVIIIGSGFAGLSAACFMAKAGWNVIVLEKHSTPGGRARQLKADGFTFDMGPSWYWMPDVFEHFFNSFAKKASDYYQLQRLDPSYRVYWPGKDIMDIPADYEALKSLFESVEPGSAAKLDKFIKEAGYKYRVGMNKLVYKPGQSVAEFLDADLLLGIFKLDVFSSISKHIAKYFHHPQLKQLLEFPLLFLGALPQKTPALYSLMNYADIKGGTWYPMEGIYSVVNGMYQLALELGVQFQFNREVTRVIIEKNMAKEVITASVNNDQEILPFNADVVIGGADYHHIESKLIPETYRTYSDKYWERRIMAPGCLIYYVGLNKKLKNLRHHSLFFDESFEIHGKEIYQTKEWPSNPLFYVNAPSVTDATVAPSGCETLFFLIPVAANLTGDDRELREKYFNMIIKRFEERLGQTVSDKIIFKKSFGPADFISEYHSFKGNAYGLANTLMQTAIFKPTCRSKKIRNLFFTGQLTVPGPGVPPGLISGEVVSREVLKNF